MHKILLVSLVLSITGGILAQSKNLRPGSAKKRSQVFGGAQDFGNYQPRGLQFSFGPTYTLTSGKNETIKPDSLYNGQRFRYMQDPAGRLGIALDVGMAHFPMKTPWLKIAGKPFRILSYWDWGLGIKLYGGKETTLVEYTDATGTNVISSETGVGKFYNTYASAHITGHKIFYFGPKYFLDMGLGINGDYRIVQGSQLYDGVHFTENQRFQKNLAVQLHYDLGLGIKLKRGSYFIPTLSTPVLGFYEWNGGTPAIKWFSSDYWPITLKAKFIFLFKEKSNGCNTGSEEDRKKNKEYMQNN
jgi:hypothetical protein|tara:strand:+ start:49911 stop:50813 length:903 start_codon:yes stop_codon:yes gene_type:complete